MAKKKILTEEEELISYNIVKYKKKQMLLLDHNKKTGYVLHSQNLRLIKFMHQRFILSVFTYLLVNVVFNLGPFISLIISGAVYLIAELIYRRFVLTKLRRIDLSAEEYQAHIDHPEMINYLRSTCITRILLYISFAVITGMQFFLLSVGSLDFFASIIILFGCTVMSIQGVSTYFKLTKKSKALKG